MRAIVALTVVVLGLSAGVLSACKDENRACCAKIVPPYEMEKASSSASESLESSAAS